MTGWTGMRWGELAGLQRHNLHLDDGLLRVNAEIGALRESERRVWLGSPMTPASVRRIGLPSFLIALLRHHLAGHDAPMVFPRWRGVGSGGPVSAV